MFGGGGTQKSNSKKFGHLSVSDAESAIQSQKYTIQRLMSDHK